MSCQDKKYVVNIFFVSYVENFILKDLEKLGSIDPDPNTGLGGCTIPMAMVIISSSELLGFLLNEKGRTGESKENIQYFFNYEIQSGKLFPNYYDPDIVEKIYNYRHGMMHHFFPKFKGKFAGICKDKSSKDIMVTHELNGLREESLNVSVLYKDFCFALDKMKEYLKDSPELAVLDNFIKGLKGLDYSLDLYVQATPMTTIPPGTPKNK